MSWNDDRRVVLKVRIRNDMEYLSDSVHRYDNRDQALYILEGNDMQQGMKLL